MNMELRATPSEQHGMKWRRLRKDDATQLAVGLLTLPLDQV